MEVMAAEAATIPGSSVIVGVPVPATSHAAERLALVRDELRGTLDLSSEGGTRVEVVFPG